MAVALATAAVPARAQQLEPRTPAASQVESYSIRSPTMGARYDVSVAAPLGVQPGSGEKYPALLVTDGNWTFARALEAVRSLQGEIEPLYVIGVGTPAAEGDSGHVRRRLYQFTAPGWTMTDPVGKVLTQACADYHSPAGRCVGGAPAFLAFLASELLPALLQRYPIDPARLGLFGWSAGGFFASWAVFQPSSPFTTYLISSPAMAFGDGDVFRQEERYAATHEDLRVGIYLGSGSLEAEDNLLEAIGRTVSGQIHFTAMLRSRHYPGLRLHSEIHAGLGHADGVAATVSRGVRVLYGR
jgi:ferri-bacillibactin esterase